jgi:hypothetical protein
MKALNISKRNNAQEMFKENKLNNIAYILIIDFNNINN